MRSMSKHGGWEPTGFGARLKRLREAAGKSQQELADLAGCNKFTVAKLEQGKQEPAWPLVLALCRSLGVSVATFEAAAAPQPEAPPARPRGRPRKASGESQTSAEPKQTRRKKAVE
jgi:DNA-binding XRE family transcriptional regulator